MQERLLTADSGPEFFVQLAACREGRQSCSWTSLADRAQPVEGLDGGITMLTNEQSIERIPGYCALCVSRCGSVAVIENGRFVALEPDPSHPTGKALCAKGQE